MTPTWSMRSSCQTRRSSTTSCTGRHTSSTSAAWRKASWSALTARTCTAEQSEMTRLTTADRCWPAVLAGTDVWMLTFDTLICADCHVCCIAVELPLSAAAINICSQNSLSYNRNTQTVHICTKVVCRIACSLKQVFDVSCAFSLNSLNITYSPGVCRVGWFKSWWF